MTSWGAAAGRWSALLGVFALASGCAALPWPQRSFAPRAVPAGAGLLDLRGVVHVHTRASHDSRGRLADLARASRRNGVVWVALSEHTRPGGAMSPRDAEGVILIPGYELRGWGGSILAMGVEALPEDYRDPAKAIRSIHARGGLAFLAHLDTAHVLPDQYEAAGLDGVEVANLHTAAVEAGYARLMVAGLLLPAPFAMARILDAADRDTSRWERLSPTAIVGGVDAHAKINLLGPMGGRIDTYARVFRMLTTHVLADQVSQAGVLRELRAGRSYVAFEGRGRVDHFGFRRHGDRFELRAPLPARLVLVCDGRHVAAARGTVAHLPVPTRAERCRAEAWRDGHRWVLTSYLPVRDPEPPASDPT